MLTNACPTTTFLYFYAVACYVGYFALAAKIPSLPRSAASLGLIGDPQDVDTPTVGGTLLAGGSTDVDEAFRWMINKSGGGDFVVLRATGTNAYNDYIYNLAPINSVETLLINSRALANDPQVERTILNAEAIFITGGDQANYVNFWKGTKVQIALNYVRNTKKIPVGGTSAGCAVLGGTYFSALVDTITSPEALNNPYNNRLTLGYRDFLDQPFLSSVVTDSHYNNRDRHGRLVTFLARMSRDQGIVSRGIGVDENTAVVIEPNGIAKVFGSEYAYFLNQNGASSTPETCLPGSRLDWNRNQRAVRVYKVKGTNVGTGYLDLNTWVAGAGGIHMYHYVRAGTLYTTYWGKTSSVCVDPFPCRITCIGINLIS